MAAAIMAWHQRRRGGIINGGVNININKLMAMAMSYQQRGSVMAAAHRVMAYGIIINGGAKQWRNM